MVSLCATSLEGWCPANAEVTLESVDTPEILQRRASRLLQNDNMIAPHHQEWLPPNFLRSTLCEDLRDQRLRFFLDAFQMIVAFETFGVNFVNLFGARWPRREPSVFGDDLQSADRRAVAGRIGQGRDDFVARQLLGLDLIG